MLVSALVLQLTSEAVYSPRLVDASFMNRMNDFDISAGYIPSNNGGGMNDFDIAAGPGTAQQPPPLSDRPFMDGMKDFNNATGPRSVPTLSSSTNVPFIHRTNDFDISAGVHAAPQSLLSDIFANTSGGFGILHKDFLDGSSFQQSMNNFEISAGREDLSSSMGGARFQQLLDNSQFRHVVSA